MQHRSTYMTALATLRDGSIAYRAATNDMERASATRLTVKALGLGRDDFDTIQRLLADGEG